MSMSGNTQDALAVLGGGLQDLGGFSGGGHQQYAQENIKANRQTRAARDLGTAIQNGLDPALAVNSYIAAGGDPATASQIMAVQSQVQKASALKLLGNYMGGGQTPQGGASPQPGGPPLPMPVPGQLPPPTPQGGPAPGYSPVGGSPPAVSRQGAALQGLPPEIRQAIFTAMPDQVLSAILPRPPIALNKDQGLFSDTGETIVPRGATKPEQWEVQNGQNTDTYQFNAQGQPVKIATAPRAVSEAPKTPDRQSQDLAIANAGKPVSNIQLNTQKGYSETVGEGLAKQDLDILDTARKAPVAIQTAQRVLGLLDSGKAITGTGAEWRLGFQKALATAGLADPGNVRATEDLGAAMASQTLDAIKASGLGAGQGFSNTDRTFLERAKGGNIEINPGTLRDLATLAERASVRSLQMGNKVAERLKGNPSFGNIGQDLYQQEPPTYAAIQALKANPAKAAEFDQYFGKGASQRYLGQ